MSNHEIIKFANEIANMDLSDLTSSDVSEFLKVISNLHEKINKSVVFQIILKRKHQIDDKYFYNHKEYYKYKLKTKKTEVPFSNLFKIGSSIDEYERSLSEVEDAYKKIESELNITIKIIESLKSKNDDDVIITLSKLSEEQIKEIEIIKSIKGISKVIKAYLSSITSSTLKKSKSNESKRKKAIDLVTSIKRIN